MTLEVSVEWLTKWNTVYPKKYAHGFVVLCFVVVMQSFIMNSHDVFIHIHQGCFAGTGAIVRLPQCQWSKPDGYGKISQCITTTKHSKAKTVCIFLGIFCMTTFEASVQSTGFERSSAENKLIVSEKLQYGPFVNIAFVCGNHGWFPFKRVSFAELWFFLQFGRTSYWTNIWAVGDLMRREAHVTSM